AGAPDARDERDLVRRPSDGSERPVEGRQHAEVAAARTPDRLQVAAQVARLTRARAAGRRSRSDGTGWRRSAPWTRRRKVRPRTCAADGTAGPGGTAPRRARRART